ncbi:glycosyltransferase family 1 protein [Rhodococcus spelaei]|uniref:Glycosyltransferase family 1 protein n=1 Tax=Rhodococcus spelaei TaxID=2546320 RepID=A0A541BRY2_9NOCA|nr:glycosyltransferase [Rhodococcus spelaei]TQF75081.1 glycosyltransferase family 1 protein [Rhodococcus spelaei]
MSEILLVTLDAGGNVPPMLGIGRELARRGHRVRVLGHERQRTAVESDGLAFRPYRRSPPWSSAEAKSNAKGLASYLRMFTGRGMGEDMLEVVRSDPADLVVVDCMLLGVLDAASHAGMRHAALVHTFYGYFRGPWFRGPIGTVGRVRRQNPRRLWDAADLVLVCTDRELDPAGPEPSNAVWSGVVQDTTPSHAAADGRRILVSLSTIAFAGQREVLQRVLDAVAVMDVSAVVTTGASIDPAELRSPSNVEMHRAFPHDRLMPHCAAVVGHGGHGTAMRALSYDVPLLILPMHPMLDQPMVGAAVARAGAGLTLRKSASPQQIRNALEALLDSPAYRQAAAATGSRIRATDGAVVAADRLLELV